MVVLPVVNKTLLPSDLPAAVTFLSKPLDKDVFLESLKRITDFLAGKSSSSTTPSILIVDDDMAFCNYLAIILEPFNYSLIMADGGAQGIELAIREKPDIMILDVSMPQLNGLQVLDKLSEVSWPKGLYVFILLHDNLPLRINVLLHPALR